MGEVYSCGSGATVSCGRHRISGNHRVAIWGQSNAIGRASGTEISSSPLSSDSGLSDYWSGSFSRVYIWTGSAYAQLSSANNQCTAGQFGPEFGLAVRWMRETTSGNLYIEKEAFSGVSITYFDPAGGNYPGMVAHRSTANSWLSSNAISVTDSGFLWIQGETDQSQTQNWYETRMQALIDARTANSLQDSGTKRVLMQMAVGSLNYAASIVAAKDAVALVGSTNTTAPFMAHYMNGDNQHQNGRGQVQAGYDAFEKIFNAAHIAT